MLLTLLPILLLTGCPDPTKDKAPAILSEPVAGPAKATAPPPTGPGSIPAPGDAVWVPATGTIGFRAAKVTRTHDAVFGEQAISVQSAAGQLTGVRVEVQVASVKTDTPKLDAHLQTADFFDVANTPTATFQSTSIRPGAPAGTGLAGATHTVEGDLAIHGVTRHVEVPAIIKPDGAGMACSTEFSIQRQDFGIAYPGKADDLISDGVLITAQFYVNTTE